MLVHLNHPRIRQQRLHRIVHLRQISPDKQRRPRHRPQRNHRPLLVLRQPRNPWLAFARRRHKHPDRQHIRIRPSPSPRILRPACNHWKLRFHALRPALPCRLLPVVPNIIGDAPKLRILPHLLRVLQRRRPRRKAQHHCASGLRNGLMNHPYLRLLIRMRSNAIHLDVVHPPPGILLHQRVVPRLPSCIRLHAKVIRIPRTHIGRIGRACWHVSASSQCVYSQGPSSSESPE